MQKSLLVKAGIAAGAVTALALIIGLSSAYTIDQGERGVLLRNGAVIGTADPGLGFKMPIIDSVRRISVQSQSRLYEDVAAYSKDQQTAVMRLSVSYNLPAGEVEEIYADYGSQEAVVTRLLDRQVGKTLEEVFGRFNAATAIQDRARLGNELQIALQEAVDGPIVVSGVQIESIDFSDAYESSIEQRMLAEVEVQRVRQNAERERVSAEIAVIQAEAQAAARLAQAEAEATAIRLRGEAEAEAIQAKAEALADNPLLIDLTKAERWDGVLPTTMLPSETLPFIDLRPAR